MTVIIGEDNKRSLEEKVAASPVEWIEGVVEETTPNHEPIGEAIYLSGYSKRGPDLSKRKLGTLCRLTHARPLLRDIREYNNEMIYLVVQEESHLLVRWNKRNGKMVVEDFTCGKTADPKMISPNNSEYAKKAFRYKTFDETVLLRGQNTLDDGKVTGTHLVCDLAGCDSHLLNQKMYLEELFMVLHKEIVGKDPDSPVIYEFKEKQHRGNKRKKPDGYSGALISGNHTDDRAIITFHTYPKEKVIMLDIDCNFEYRFGKVLRMLEEHLEGDKKNYQVLDRKYR